MCNKKQKSRHRNRDATTASRFRRFVEGSAVSRNAGAKARPPRRRRRRASRGSSRGQAQPADHRAAGDVEVGAAATGCRLSLPTTAPQATLGLTRQQPGAGSACQEIETRPPRLDFVGLQKVWQCAETQEPRRDHRAAGDIEFGAAATGCRLSLPTTAPQATLGLTRQQPGAGSACQEIETRPPRLDFVGLQKVWQCAETQEPRRDHRAAGAVEHSAAATACKLSLQRIRFLRGGGRRRRRCGRGDRR